MYLSRPTSPIDSLHRAAFFLSTTVLGYKVLVADFGRRRKCMIDRWPTWMPDLTSDRLNSSDFLRTARPCRQLSGPFRVPHLPIGVVEPRHFLTLAAPGKKAGQRKKSRAVEISFFPFNLMIILFLIFYADEAIVDHQGGPFGGLLDA